MTSCSEDKPLDTLNSQNGAFVRFSGSEVKTMSYTLGKAVFDIEDANNNAVAYKIYQIKANIGGVEYPVVPANFTYSLPSHVEIPFQDLAGLFGLTAADLYYGDSFTFYAQVTTTDGRVIKGEVPDATATYPSGTNPDLLNTTYGYKQAMQFSLTVACPSYTAQDMVGTYTVSFDEFDEYSSRTPSGYQVQCVLGDQPNTLKFINFSNIGTDLVVTIDPASQSVTSSRTTIYNNFYTYGDCYATGLSGLVFSCIGQLQMNFSYSVGAGTFSGTYQMVFTKN